MFSSQDVTQKEERINLQLNNALNKDSHPNHSIKSRPSSSCRLDKIPPNAKYEREKKSIDVHNLAIRVVRTVSRAIETQKASSSVHADSLPVTSLLPLSSSTTV